MKGQFIAYLGLAFCVLCCGLGSAIGLKKTGTAAAGVIAEDGKKASKVLLLAVLPATQGIYGFLLAVMKMNSIPVDLTVAGGLTFFAKTLPLTVVGLMSAILQGKTAVAAILATAKNDTANYILYPAMVETYAILALVVSILLI